MPPRGGRLQHGVRGGVAVSHDLRGKDRRGFPAEEGQDGCFKFKLKSFVYNFTLLIQCVVVVVVMNEEKQMKSV